MTREMKNSGIDWIGEIPADWNIIKSKYIFKNHKEIVGDREKDFERLSLTLNGVLKRPKDDSKGLQSESLSTYQILYEDELVFKMIDLENTSTSRVGYSPYTGLVSPVYIIFNNKEYAKYGYYYFYNLWQRNIYNTLGNNGVRSALNASDMLNLPFIQVPKEEMNKIVAFLENKVSEIDKIISETKSSIENYKEYKNSVITDAVTKGLDKNTSMKKTGNIHIPVVPEHWEFKKMKYLFYIKKDIAGQEGYEILSITQKGIKIKDISNNEGQLANSYANYQIVNIGDFAMNHMDLLTGWVDISKYEGVTSPDYRVFNLLEPEKHNKYYYLYLMQMCYANKIFYGLGQGVSNLGRWRLQADKFLNFTVPQPPIEEQNAISEYLNSKCSEIDNLIFEKEALVSNLEEYKKSLIYEYVTGKKEVEVAKNDENVIIIAPIYPAVYNTKKARFAQAVLMSKILATSNNNKGRVKLEKTLYTIEHHIGFDFETEYKRDAAGPLDNSLYKCETIISSINKWFNINSSNYGVSYKPTKNVNKYTKYYNKYFTDYDTEIERIIRIFDDFDTDKAEIIATLYAVWNDFIIDNKTFTDEDIANDVLNNWHDSKKRFAKDVWLRAMDEMRELNLVPKGYGKKTVAKGVQ